MKSNGAMKSTTILKFKFVVVILMVNLIVQ
jgi:hypothetical protein